MRIPAIEMRKGLDTTCKESLLALWVTGCGRHLESQPRIRLDDSTAHGEWKKGGNTDTAPMLMLIALGLASRKNHLFKI